MRLFFSVVGCFVSFASLAQVPAQLNYTIAPWFHNRQAAVSLTFDDGIPGQYSIAVPLLDKFGFKGTFFTVVAIVNNQRISWEDINETALKGHEIGNHALTHPHFIKIPLDAVRREVADASKHMNMLVPAQQMITLAYPYGEGGGYSAKDQAIRKTIAPYFIAARATQNKLQPYNAYNFAKTNEDYYMINSQMITDAETMNNFGKYIDETIAAGGWFCPTYHGIENGWIITPGKVFEKHLKELDKRKASLWIAPFKNVIQYHKERNSAKLKLVESEGWRWKLSLTDTLSNRKNFDQPLTININTNGYSVYRILRKGRKMPFKQTANMLLFDAVPGPEYITIDFVRVKPVKSAK
ncbi:polysaccharide deacetylase family protein [Mucilaginibacter pedocola]|uniref:NodB homology domain-containing protein n=1 Tax=Mucilaginibacter pedocola TaxID=1792845 RepID=A0A1S9PIR9_9SPHI|nr:polysaccharide deacetylase family protein [Mucilaginibacter pedocola]OOQ60846.1 hypothetical protein BC343_23040 [Mucilaginibacter pedocola]